jgi:hypothetical protein
MILMPMFVVSSCEAYPTPRRPNHDRNTNRLTMADPPYEIGMGIVTATFAGSRRAVEAPRLHLARDRQRPRNG